MVLSAPGTVVVMEHIAPLVPVHIVAPGRQFEKQGRKPGSFVVQAEAGADRYVAMGMPRQKVAELLYLKLVEDRQVVYRHRAQWWGGGEEFRGKNQAVSCPFRKMVADFVANKIGVTFNPHDVEGAGNKK